MNYIEKIYSFDNLFKDKIIAILGFGKEGISTYNFFQKYFPKTKLLIADINENLTEKHPYLKLNSDVDIYLGENHLAILEIANLVVKSPGISLKNRENDKYNEKITSQTDLFLKLFSEQVIGITGTKGKSTTTSLIFHILQKCFKNPILVGNIGLPPFEIIENIMPDTNIVFEMSSHQLQNVHTSPHISVLLNIYQEHLDHYNSYFDYQRAKLNITAFQKENDYFIYNSDSVDLAKIVNSTTIKSNVFEYSLKKIEKNGLFVENSKIFSKYNGQIKELGSVDFERKIKGDHNLSNILAAVKVSEIVKIPYDNSIKAIADFSGLEHRLEYFGSFKGIKFYNDSISTIPEATIAAIETVKDTETLILGGFDRGISYIELADYLMASEVNNFIFLGEAGKRIHREMEKKKNKTGKKFYFAENMAEVVKFAFKITSKNKSCLLSPAASSYDLFRNFEHRGKIFKETVVEYSKKI